MEVVSKIQQILEGTAEQIRANMSAQNINASGRTSSSTRTEVYDEGVRLVIGGERTAPLATLEVGRPGGAVPVGFYEIIKQWSRDKGLEFESERERGTFAYFVAKKIAAEGTARHKSPVDVYSTPVREAVGRIKDVFAEDVAAVVKTALQVTNAETHF